MFQDKLPNGTNRPCYDNIQVSHCELYTISVSFYTELFSLLTSLFPEENKNKEKDKKKKDEKILRKENEKYYDFLSKKIIKTLVDNIMSKSACSTLSNLVQLILAFSKTSTKENIENCINPKQMAQIIGKLLDTRYEPYVNDLLVTRSALPATAGSRRRPAL